MLTARGLPLQSRLLWWFINHTGIGRDISRPCGNSYETLGGSPHGRTLVKRRLLDTVHCHRWLSGLEQCVPGSRNGGVATRATNRTSSRIRPISIAGRCGYPNERIESKVSRLPCSRLLALHSQRVIIRDISSFKFGG
jgi:hypothetical protein